MDLSALRIALFSGNYNYTLDGANLALNRLVGFLLEGGAAVRVYSPTVAKPAFPATGDLVGVPALPIPGRLEYRLAYRIGRRVRNDLDRFAPNLIHVSAPELLGHWAASYARKHDIAAVASVHTRFDAYLHYYRLGLFEARITAVLRRFYQRFDAIVAPAASVADILRNQHMNGHVGIWPSGVDRALFNPAARSLEWRRSMGIDDDEVVVGFVGRLVVEKGIGVFCDTIDELTRRGVKVRVLVVGDGPARGRFSERLPNAIFLGFQTGDNLGRAIASMDVFLNPSVTETFGIVTLEAMSCGLPVVGANATGTSNLITDGTTGRLVKPGDIAAFADAVQAYVADPATRTIAGAAGNDVAATYSWDAVNQMLATQYLEVMARRSGKGGFASTKAA